MDREVDVVLEAWVTVFVAALNHPPGRRTTPFRPRPITSWPGQQVALSLNSSTDFEKRKRKVKKIARDGCTFSEFFTYRWMEEASR